MSDFGYNSSVKRYRKLEILGKGSYGKVYKVEDSLTGSTLAMKKTLIEIETDGIPASTLREISMLRQLSHPNIIQLEDLAMSVANLYLLFEFMPYDLKKYLDYLPGPPQIDVVGKIMGQLLKATHFCHVNRVIHRDLKPQNLLLDESLNLKVGDFGLSRNYQIPTQPYTSPTQTLWYRAPEVLLRSSNYSTAIDIWSIGCIFAELLSGKPLFPARSNIDQLFLIFRIMGTPNEASWPGFTKLKAFRPDFPVWKKIPLKDLFPRQSEETIDLLEKMLTLDPVYRISAKQALAHPFFINHL